MISKVEEVKKQIKKLPLWKDKKMSIKLLKGGLTNLSFCVMVDTLSYIVRHAPPQAKQLGIFKSREIFNTTLAAKRGIGPKVVAYFPKKHLLVLEFIPGKILPKQKLQKEMYIKKIARTLKKVHQSSTFKGNGDIFSITKNYYAKALAHAGWAPTDFNALKNDFLALKKKLEKKVPLRPCHFDLMIENIIVTPFDEIKLIDWEYSLNADFRADLAMLSVKAGFLSHHDQVLCREYDRTNKFLYQDVQLMKKVIFFKEACWGLLQFSITKKKLYKQYALENFKGFKGTIAHIMK